MSETKLSDFADDFSLLIEAGFIAVKQLDEVSAVRLFTAAQAISPKNTAPQIGLGYIALNKLEIKESTRIFEDVVTKEPENHLAQMFLGMSYILNKSKRKKGEKLIRDTLVKTKDPTIINLGKLALEWSQKDLSKSKSPFFNQPEKEILEKENSESESREKDTSEPLTTESEPTATTEQTTIKSE